MKKLNEPDWAFWRSCQTLRIWEAAALSLSLEPRSILDPKNSPLAEYLAGIKIRANGRAAAHREPEYFRRIKILRRAMLHPQSGIVAVAIDPDSADNAIVTAESVRAFFAAHDLATPAEWGPPQKRTGADERRSDAADWKARARKFGLEEHQRNPRLGLEQIAELVKGRLIAAEIVGRGGRYLSAGSIRRHALTGLKR